MVRALGIRALPISFAQTNLRDAALPLADCVTWPLFEANHDMASAALSLEYEDRADIDALQFGCAFARACLTRKTCATARRILLA